MQHIEGMNLRSSLPAAKPTTVSLAEQIVRAQDEHPPAAPSAARAATPTPRPSRGRFESRPAGASPQMVARGGFWGVIQRLNNGEPALWAELRNNPDTALRLRQAIDRLLGDRPC